jgi:hypothetical protein
MNNFILLSRESREAITVSYKPPPNDHLINEPSKELGNQGTEKKYFLDLLFVIFIRLFFGSIYI